MRRFLKAVGGDIPNVPTWAYRNNTTLAGRLMNQGRGIHDSTPHPALLLLLRAYRAQRLQEHSPDPQQRGADLHVAKRENSQAEGVQEANRSG